MSSAGVPLTVFPSRVSPPTIPAASTVQMPAAVTTSSTTVPASLSSSVPSTAGGKDSRWLTLEVCREHVRRRCARSDDECRFAHPPPHVEVQNGRVVCCFDSIKGRCQRTDPPCKYLHPPQHLKEQLLQNGRHNLIMRNLHLQRLQPLQPTAIYSFVSPYLVQTSPPPACYAPYFGSTSPCVAQSTMSTAGPGASNGIVANMMPTAAAASTTTMTPSCSQLENDCAVDETVPSSGGDPYWTVAPPIFAVDNATSPAASYYSPVFFQSVGAAPPSGLMLKPQQTMVGGDGKNGYAIYSCGSSAYPQLALPMPQGPCYPMTITAAPPVVAGSFPRY